MISTEIAVMAYEQAQQKEAAARRQKEAAEDFYAERPTRNTQGWRADKGPQASNKSGFRATGHRILLMSDVVEETTSSGIVLPKKAVKAEQDMAVTAIVVEIGWDAWADKSTDYCQVGDRVLLGQYTGKFHESPVDGKIYRFVNDLDIISPVNV